MIQQMSANGGKLPTLSSPLKLQQQNSSVKFTDEPCAHCGLYWSDEEEWVKCRSCPLCYHISCVVNEEYIEEDDFICPDCENDAQRPYIQTSKNTSLLLVGRVCIILFISVNLPYTYLLNLPPASAQIIPCMPKLPWIMADRLPMR